MISDSKLLMSAFILSFASCLSTIKETIKEKSSTLTREAPAAEQPADESSAPQTTVTPAPPPSSAPAAPAAATPMTIRSGHMVIAQNGPSKKFLRHVSHASCASGRDAEILLFNTDSARPTAVLTRSGCTDIAPTTLTPASYALAESDPNVLIYDGQIFDIDAPGGATTLINCDGARDSAGRDVSVIIKTLSAASTGARISIRGLQGPEVFQFAVQESFQKKMRRFEMTPPDGAPQFSFAVGNVNGLTGFASYDFFAVPDTPGGRPALKARGLLSENRRESNLNFPHCVSR